MYFTTTWPFSPPPLKLRMSGPKKKFSCAPPCKARWGRGQGGERFVLVYFIVIFFSESGWNSLLQTRGMAEWVSRLTAHLWEVPLKLFEDLEMSFLIPTPTVRLRTPSCLASYQVVSLWDPWGGKICPPPCLGPPMASFWVGHLQGQAVLGAHVLFVPAWSVPGTLALHFLWTTGPLCVSCSWGRNRSP